MASLVALLRGVNVGGKNPVPMAQLRELVESLGATEVRTYIQSGNVIFADEGRITSTALEEAIRARFSLDIRVVLRTATELTRAMQANPFPTADVSAVHIGFMAVAPSAALVAGIDREPFLPDEFEVIGTEMYLHLPNGQATTRLPAHLGRRLKVPTTVRNWTTVAKLAALAE
ncbi:MAG: DUF1697 domain-containing protein [Candidatus Dormibacteraeota bacterium]|uniref:DUF1697 domain-containing protein n=1 Tax=Candidatus Amunia macphersoniae TaxID=3127014 RepID=A0A934NGU8_9BACT|nr:DUF1697 domain-containing protein [Candidatus Dormibacteraeota bacterium]